LKVGPIALLDITDANRAIQGSAFLKQPCSILMGRGKKKCKNEKSEQENRIFKTFFPFNKITGEHQQ
jgi:hypothetical protein